MKPHAAQFKFHGCLTDFLEPEKQDRAISYAFRDHPGIKDPVESLGIPHSEVGKITVNGQQVNFSYQLQAHDQVEVYPLLPGKPASAEDACFIVDVNLGKLTRWLRLLGFDTLWRNNLKDREIVDIATSRRRIILTRDRRLLFHREIRQGYWIRTVEPFEQIVEVLDRLVLWDYIRPFLRCTDCNGLIQVIGKEKIKHKLEPLTNKYYDDFYQCTACGKIYWRGSHYENLLKKLKVLKDARNHHHQHP